MSLTSWKVLSVGTNLRNGRLLNAKPQGEPKTREGRKENDDHSKEGEKSLRLCRVRNKRKKRQRDKETRRRKDVSNIKLAQKRKTQDLDAVLRVRRG